MHRSCFFLRMALACAGALAASTAVPAREPVAHGRALHTSEPWIELTVVRRDSLIGLSRQVLVSTRAWREVASFNRLADPDYLVPGQVLRVPARLVKMSPASAQVIDVEGEVQISDANGVRAMHTGESLPEGAQIEASDRSSAVVSLADGSQMRILPNSLAALSASRVVAGRTARGVPAPASVAANAPSSAPSDGGPRRWTPASEGWFVGTMRLVRGSLEVLASKIRRAKPLEVETPTTVVGVRGTDYRVGVDAAAPTAPLTRIEVIEGRVQVDAITAASRGARSATPLSAGQGAVVDARGGVRVEPLLSAPDLSGLAQRIDVPLVRFDWPHPAPVRVQVSRTADFNAVVFDQTVAANEPLRIAGLEDGTWHLRVRQIAAAGIEGYDARHVFVLKARPEPPASQAPQPHSKHPVGQLTLAWAPNARASATRVQIARDAAFSQIVGQRNDLAGDRVSLALDQPGLYFWRLASVAPPLNNSPDGAPDLGPWGGAQSFELRALPTAPQSRQADDGALLLSWGGGAPAGVRYAVELARDLAFGDVITTQELADPQWRIVGPGWHNEPGSVAVSGTVYFRYRSIDPDGYVSPPSEPLRVELPRDPRGPWLLLAPLMLVPLL